MLLIRNRQCSGRAGLVGASSVRTWYVLARPGRADLPSPGGPDAEAAPRVPQIWQTTRTRAEASDERGHRQPLLWRVADRCVVLEASSTSVALGGIRTSPLTWGLRNQSDRLYQAQAEILKR